MPTELGTNGSGRTPLPAIDPFDGDFANILKQLDGQSPPAAPPPAESSGDKPNGHGATNGSGGPPIMERPADSEAPRDSERAVAHPVIDATYAAAEAIWKKMVEDLEADNRRLTKANEDLTEENRGLAKANEDLTKKNLRLTTDSARLIAERNTAQTTLKEEREAGQQLFANLEREKRELNERIGPLEAQAARLRTEVERLMGQLVNAAEELEEVTTKLQANPRPDPQPYLSLVESRVAYLRQQEEGTETEPSS